jgi:hypothetical protein
MNLARDFKSLDKGLPIFCFSFSARRAGIAGSSALSGRGEKQGAVWGPAYQGLKSLAKSVRPPGGADPSGLQQPARTNRRGHSDFRAGCPGPLRRLRSFIRHSTIENPRCPDRRVPTLCQRGAPPKDHTIMPARRDWGSDHSVGRDTPSD